MNIQSVLAEIQLEDKVIPITGGDVNQTYRIEEQNKSYFLKLHPNIGKSFFEAEVDGLKNQLPTFEYLKLTCWVNKKMVPIF